jgi:hypothetical protein
MVVAELAPSDPEQIPDGQETLLRAVIVPCLHRTSVHHGQMAEMGGIGGTKADRQITLEAHVDRRLGRREATRQRLRERDDRLLYDERARLAVRVVLERLRC